jgi:polyferredoxin
MDKLDRPRGLISYATLADYADNMALAQNPETGVLDPTRVRTADGGFIDKVKHFDWRIIFRPRSLLYMGVWSAVGIGLLVALLSRDRLEVNVLHDRNPQFVMESNGDIRNGYSIKILNMIAEPRVISLSLDGLPGASMRVVGIDEAPGVSRSRSRSSRTGCANSRCMCSNPRSSSHRPVPASVSSSKRMPVTNGTSMSPTSMHRR